MATKKDDSSTRWEDLAIGLYDRLTGRHAEITYEFEDLKIGIPSSTADDAEYAIWKFDGIIKIRTQNV